MVSIVWKFCEQINKNNNKKPPAQRFCMLFVKLENMKDFNICIEKFIWFLKTLCKPNTWNLNSTQKGVFNPSSGLNHVLFNMSCNLHYWLRIVQTVSPFWILFGLQSTTVVKSISACRELQVYLEKRVGFGKVSNSPKPYLCSIVYYTCFIFNHSVGFQVGLYESKNLNRLVSIMMCW